MYVKYSYIYKYYIALKKSHEHILIISKIVFKIL